MSQPRVSLGGGSTLLDPARVADHYRDVLPPSVRGSLEDAHRDQRLDLVPEDLRRVFETDPHANAYLMLWVPTDRPLQDLLVALVKALAEDKARAVRGWADLEARRGPPIITVVMEPIGDVLERIKGGG